MNPVPFHLMIKPVGARCNLACEYCYYLEKSAFYPESSLMMDDETLARVTEAYLRENPTPEVVFGWQGGEPLLAGIDFFRRAVEMQRQHARPGQRALNALQTNATLVTDEWAAFFAEEGFLVGVSIDGPPELHNRYRRDRGHQASYDRVVKGIETLRRHGVEINGLVTVNRENAAHPQKVYRQLIQLGFEHIQFIPIVERESRTSRKVTPWSVRPEAYGEFLCAVFDAWARNDMGRVYVQLFEVTLGVWMGQPPALCVFAPTCGNALAVEHNGDLYACDHFVYPDHQRGNAATGDLSALVSGKDQRAFGQAKTDLPRECRACQVRRFCHGDCPKHRIRPGTDGKPLSCLCPAYQRFFTHSADVLYAVSNELRAGRPATNVMEVLKMLQ